MHCLYFLMPICKTKKNGESKESAKKRILPHVAKNIRPSDECTTHIRNPSKKPPLPGRASAMEPYFPLGARNDPLPPSPPQITTGGFSGHLNYFPKPLIHDNNRKYRTLMLLRCCRSFLSVGPVAHLLFSRGPIAAYILPGSSCKANRTEDSVAPHHFPDRERKSERKREFLCAPFFYR